MNDYVLEYMTGKRKVHVNVKASSINNLRSRIIKENSLMKEERVMVFLVGSGKTIPDHQRPTGTMWYDGYNRKYLWMDGKGKVSMVTKGGYLTEFGL